jgi:6-phosphogluconate dehydrogenase (decarboxylating)
MARAVETPPAIEQLSVNTIRTLAMDAVQQASSGHPGTAMAMAPVVYTLWQQFLRFDLDVPEIAELWRRGSVVGSWLLDLSAMALAESPVLEEYTGSVQDSGEGRWTIMAAIEEAVPADVLSAALYTRFRSRQEHTFAEKLLSAMRYKFGGHVERAAGG